jgi:hypothetical protein
MKFKSDRQRKAVMAKLKSKKKSKIKKFPKIQVKYKEYKAPKDFEFHTVQKKPGDPTKIEAECRRLVYVKKKVK